LRLLPEFSGFSAADTTKMEAEKAPAILADFGCNVNENKHRIPILSISFTGPEYEMKEIQVYERHA
jgi:hypothetical protein